MSRPRALPSTRVGLDGLKRDVRAGDDTPETLRAVAKQFESLFAQMLIKSMRATSFGDGLMDSEQSEFYRDMFDQQMAVELSQGKGLGLADLLMRQLSGLDAQRRAPAAARRRAGSAVPMPAPRRAVAPAGASPRGDRLPAGRTRKTSSAQLWPHAEAAGRALGVDPATIVSHAALETGWGRSLPQRGQWPVSSFNLFGIKAGRAWRGDAAVASSTVEYVGGAARPQQERFRAYESLASCVADYARCWLAASRYSAALNTGGDVGCVRQALQRAVTRPIPAMPSKLQSVAIGRCIRDARRGVRAQAAATSRPIHPARSAAT
jgi:peptidoglycan hydrolase FlgJ